MSPLLSDPYTLLHNPRCSKSRAAKTLLEERDVKFVERLYLDEPLTRDELEEVTRRLGKPIGSWVRMKEPAFSEAGLSKASLDDELFDAVANAPSLMERPILVTPTAARVGRPPEDILELIA